MLFRFAGLQLLVQIEFVYPVGGRTTREVVKHQKDEARKLRTSLVEPKKKMQTSSTCEGFPGKKICQARSQRKALSRIKRMNATPC